MSRSERITSDTVVTWVVCLLCLQIQVACVVSIYELAGMAKQCPYKLWPL